MSVTAADLRWDALLDGRVALITGAGSGQGRAADAAAYISGTVIPVDGGAAARREV